MRRKWTKSQRLLENSRLHHVCPAFTTQRISVVVCWMFVAICAQHGLGDLRSYEGFDYEDIGDELLHNDGGFGFAGPWYPGSGIGTSPLIITEDSLGSEQIGSIGNRLHVSSGGGWNGLLRRLSSAIPANETETMYMSFLMRPERGSGRTERPIGWGSVGFIGVVDGNAPWAGYSGSRYQMTEFSGRSESKASDVPAVLNEESLFVVRADMTPRQDTFTFYVDPVRGEPEPNTGIVKTENMPGLGRIYVAVGDNAAFSVDEIRLGETYFDVTPLDIFHVGGESQIGTYSVNSGVRSNLVYEPTGPVSPGLTQEWFQARNPGNKADLDFIFDNESTVVHPFNASQGSTWWTGRQSAIGQLVKYPAEITPPMHESRNDNYVVRATGELFIPESGTYRFADGTGEYAYWAIDVDGSGVAGDSLEEVIMDDNQPTNLSRSRGGGWGEVEFDVEDGGEWLTVEFNMGKTTDRRDAGIIYWDYDPTSPEGQRLGGVPGFPKSARDDISEQDGDVLLPDRAQGRVGGSQLIDQIGREIAR